MLQVTPDIAIPLEQIELSAMRAQGKGGQNVNKTSSAIHLRFDVARSALPEDVKSRLLKLAGARATGEGAIVIKAQEFRSQDQNRDAALARLSDLVRRAATVPRTRRPTRPTRAAKRRRVDEKVRRGKLKSLRGSIDD